MTRRGAGGGPGLRPLQGRGRRRHPWRTLPGTHPTKGSYFTRGTTRDAYARYSERGPDYIYNVERLLKKFATAATLVPQPVLRGRPREDASWACIYFGSTSPAMHEALEALERGRHPSRRDAAARLSLPRQRGAVPRRSTTQVFVVEQNRDAQMRSLLVNELGVDPARLVAVLHFDGTPITARFIAQAITRACAIAAWPARQAEPRKEQSA